MSKHADLANRIFRTVVFSGAMLGSAAPALADTPPPPPQQSKPQPPPADTWDSVNKQLEATDAKLDKAVTEYVAAIKALVAKKEGSGTGIALATQKVDELKKTRADLVDRLGKTTRPAFVNVKAAPAVEKAETAWGEANTKLFASIDAVAAAKEDADMKKAAADLDAAKKARVTAFAKVKAERAKANKRPRAPESERPTGRGFILS